MAKGKKSLSKGRRGDRSGKEEVAEPSFTREELAGGMPGRVVAHHGVAVLVRFDEGGERQIWLTRDQRAVAGDRVIVVGERLIVEPSEGVLRRRDARGRERTIAVNLDLLGIVIAPEPREPPGYIDRGFVIARAAGIEPVLILNKCDLPGASELADRLEEIYGESSSVHRVSAKSSEGIEVIPEMLAGGRMGALVGASGVGKSSLLNVLCENLDLRVSELNRKSHQGRHTTTTATLHALSGGGFLVDTAGFKDFVAVGLDPLEAAGFFPGFEMAIEEGCRFRDCLHQTEPDCSVQAAVSGGTIPQTRHRAYVSLIEELLSPPKHPRAQAREKSR